MTRDELILRISKQFPYLVTHQNLKREYRNQLTGNTKLETDKVVRSERSPERVNLFWSSRPLGHFGQLSIRSILAHGHPTYLYTYDDRSQLRHQVPDGVRLADAREVLPFGLYEECLAKREIHAFSDIFRYALLYAQGGWWLDTDILLLKQLNFALDHVFSTQWFGLEGGHVCVNDVIKAPSGSKHMRRLYEVALARWNSGEHLEFGALGPSLLTEYVLSDNGAELVSSVLPPTYFNSIDWTEVDLFTTENDEAFALLGDPRVTGVHLWSKAWHDNSLTPDSALPRSVFRYLTELFTSSNPWSHFTSAHTRHNLRLHEKRASTGYERVYVDLLRNRFLEKLNILEIGALCDEQAGSDQDQLASTKTLLDLFPNAYVSSLRQSGCEYMHPRVMCCRVDQLTNDSLAGFIEQQSEGIDIVIDYGTYPSSERQLALGMLYPIVNRYGLYILEELQSTGQANEDVFGQLVRQLHDVGTFNSDVLSAQANAVISDQTAFVRIYDNIERLLADRVHGDLGILVKSGDWSGTFARARPNARQTRRVIRDDSRRLAFQDVYARGLWGSDGDARFFSGIGSRGPAVSSYVEALCEILKDNIAQMGRPITVVDLGCGDFSVGREILSRMPDLSYIGCDIVPELVEHNRGLFSSDRISFFEIDIVEDQLPSGDVCLVRQVLQHLSNRDVEAVLPKLTYPYVYITESQPLERVGPVNPDKPAGWDVRFDWRTGRGRGLELDQPPFSRKLKELWRATNPSGLEMLLMHQLMENMKSV